MGLPRFEPGEIVTVVIVDPRALAKYGDIKPRPAVLIGPASIPGHWRAMGFTSLSHYEDGNPRVFVGRPINLTRDSYLWSPKLPIIPEADIGAHIGWATNDLVDAIAALTGLSLMQVEPMRPHARRDRARARRRPA